MSGFYHSEATEVMRDSPDLVTTPKKFEVGFEPCVAKRIPVVVMPSKQNKCKRKIAKAEREK